MSAHHGDAMNPLFSPTSPPWSPPSPARDDDTDATDDDDTSVFPDTRLAVPATRLFEPLLDVNRHRLSLFPIEDPDIYAAYKKHVACFWTPEEIDLTGDKAHFDRLTKSEQHFVSNILAFFAQADGIVAENLCENFATEVQLPEAKCFYGFQLAMENIHNETYSLLIDSYIQDSEEKYRLFHAVSTMPCIHRKAEWTLQWCDPQRATFAERIIAFAAVEGVFFSGAFCAIYWLKKRGLMPGLCFANELISRDEGLHCDFACLLHRKLLQPASPIRIRQIVDSAVQIEKEFVRDSLPVRLIGMNSTLMCQYVEFVADRLLAELGQPRLYEVPNPFEWMVTISLQGKTNFFEKRVGEYAKSGVGVDAKENHVFSLDEDF